MGSLRPMLAAAPLIAMMAACGLELVGLRATDDGVAGDADAPESTGLEGSTSNAEVEATSEVGPPIEAGADADATVKKDADAGVTCTDPGGQVFAGHCYFTLTARTQSQAKTDCAAAGAHLVTVNSLGEHNFLGGVGTGDRWIGLQAPVPTNDRAQYKWVTNEPNTVAYWYPNDPDNMGPCVAFRSALQSPESWVDRGCGESNVPICERQ